VNLEINDPFLLATVNPRNAQGYLQSSGWRQSFLDAGVVSVWTRPGTPDDHEVRLPLNPEASGYANRVRELLHEVAGAEERSPFRIFLDIKDWNCDTIRLAYKARPEMDFNTLAGSLKVLASAKEILSSVAASVVDPQPWYGKKRPREASDYLGELGVSTFEEPLCVRVLAAIKPPLFDGDDEAFTPMSRRVSLRLCDALNCLDRFVKRSSPVPEPEWLDSMLRNGVSANVTDSLSQLLQLPAAFGSSIEISLRLAAIRTFNGAAISTWQFRRQHLDVFSAIGERLRTFTVTPDQQLIFLVAKVHQKSISATALVKGEAKSVHMALDDELIRIAEIAKERNAAIRCFGRPRHNPATGRFEILQPHSFQLVLDHDTSVEELRRRLPARAEATTTRQIPLIGEA
jgi:hypothetical protein